MPSNWDCETSPSTAMIHDFQENIPLNLQGAHWGKTLMLIRKFNFFIVENISGKFGKIRKN